MSSKRKSPSESATRFKLGTRKRGNDGNMWIITQTKNKVKRWTLATPKKAKSKPEPEPKPKPKPKPKTTTQPKKKPKRNKETTPMTFTSMMINKSVLKSVADLENMPESYYQSANKWLAYLKDASKELFKSGIFLFPYPMGYVWVDYASEDVDTYLENNQAFKEYLVSKKLVESIDFEIDEVGYLYYMAVSNEANEIYLKHNLPNPNIKKKVYQVLQKHFGKKMVWNKSNSQAIKIKLKDKPGKKNTSFLTLVKRYLDKQGFQTKVVKRGKYSPENMLTETSHLSFKGNPQKLENILKKIGVWKSKLNKSYIQKNGLALYPETFMIDSSKKMLYINMTDIGGETYNIVSAI